MEQNLESGARLEGMIREVKRELEDRKGDDDENVLGWEAGKAEM